MPQSSIPFNYSIVGKALKAARAKTGLTTREVADLLGCVSSPTLNRAEQGRKIELPVFIVLFKFYDLDPFDDLIVPDIEPLDWPEDGERSAA